LANFSFQDTFGGHSGVIQNPDGTFTAKRLVQGSTDPTKYEQNTYKLSEDGKSLVPVSDTWTPITIKDSGFWDTPLSVLKEAGPLFLAAYGLPQLAGSLAGTTAATGAAGTAGSTAPLALSGTITPETFMTMADLPAIGGAAGTSTLGASLLSPSVSGVGNTAPLELSGAIEPAVIGSTSQLPIMLSGTLPTASIGSTATLPALGNVSGSGGTLANLASGLLSGSNLPNLLTLAGLAAGQKGQSGTRAAAPLPDNYKPLTYGTPSGIFGKYDPTAEELAAPGSQGMFANYLKRELTRGG
jgi:hypothetical protein